MKKKLLIGLMLLVLAFATGCAGTDDATKVQKSLNEVYAELTATEGLPELLRLDDEFITGYYGADLASFEEYVFAASEDPLLAETIILVKLKEGESPDAVKKLMENLLTQKKRELQNYLPQQYEIVEKSEIVSSGSYISLIISSKQEELKKLAASYLE